MVDNLPGTTKPKPEKNDSFCAGLYEEPFTQHPGNMSSIKWDGGQSSKTQESVTTEGGYR